MQLKANEEMTIVGKYIEEKRLMQYKGEATCKIKNSLCVMHNIMRTMILEHDDEISRYHNVERKRRKWRLEAGIDPAATAPSPHARLDVSRSDLLTVQETPLHD